MGRAGSRGAAVLAAVAVAVWVLDRATKLWAERTLPGAPIELVPGALTLRYTTNSGGAFGIGRSAPWLFVGASLVVVVAIVLTAFRPRSAPSAAGLGLILGGALGNLTDRAVRAPGFAGEVVDFIDLHVWPVFNLADASIVVGALVLVVTSAAQDRRRDGA
ncbi:MAG: lipoprotein signal peptidase [Actinomycetota bacterium]|nr:MAG: lipoprotein signal peptidase [Actinomycetota bacterium]